MSVGEIAKAVGIKAPSLYNHYPSKQAIFDAIVKETAERYEKFTNDIDIHVQNADADTDVFSNITEEFLIQKVRSIFLYSLHDNAISRFRRMMTIEQFRSAELSELYTNRYVKRLVDYHSGIFKNLISNGEIIDENTETLALMQYMINHNAAHARELEGLAKKLGELGNEAAAQQVLAAVSEFEKGNVRLSAVLASLK